MPAGECRGRLAVALPAHCVAQERARRYRFNVQSMKRITLYIVLIVAGFAALMAAASWSGRREPASVANHGTRKVLYYVDPMHPAYKSDKPGTAPDCGMKLEPVYEGSAGAAAMPRAPGDEAVRVSADRRELIGVRVEAVTKEARTERLRLYGRVAPEETRVYRVNVGIEGYVREISDVTTGSQVAKISMARHVLRAGSAHLDSVVSGGGRRRRQRDAAARGHAESARLGLEFAAERLLALGISRAQIEEIRRTRVVPPAFRIVAPASGFVIARNLTAGEKVPSGQELFQIADLRRVWILADVAGRRRAARSARAWPREVDGARAAPRRCARGQPRGAAAVRSVEPVVQRPPRGRQSRLRAAARHVRGRRRAEVALPPAIAVPADAVVDAGPEQARLRRAQPRACSSRARCRPAAASAAASQIVERAERRRAHRACPARSSSTPKAGCDTPPARSPGHDQSLIDGRRPIAPRSSSLTLAGALRRLVVAAARAARRAARPQRHAGHRLLAAGTAART